MIRQASSYHLRELAIIRNPDDPRRCVPQHVADEWAVLDIGCGIGQTLTAEEFAKCSNRRGVDIDAEAIAAGKAMFPHLSLFVAHAENLPFADCSFDFAFSRVALPYMNIPLVLREIFRVLKPGGKIWLVLHGWENEKLEIKAAVLHRNVSRLFDRVYVIVNSVVFAISGRCIARPWSGQFESFQTKRSISRSLRAAKFEDVTVTIDRFFIAEAHRAK